MAAKIEILCNRGLFEEQTLCCVICTVEIPNEVPEGTLKPVKDIRRLLNEH